MRVDLLSGVAVRPDPGYRAICPTFRQTAWSLSAGERRRDRHRLPTGCQLARPGRVRRYFHAPLRPTLLPAAQFERLLQDHYEGDSNGAARTSGRSRRGNGSQSSGDGAAEPESLLESAVNDAPIIG